MELKLNHHRNKFPSVPSINELWNMQFAPTNKIVLVAITFTPSRLVDHSFLNEIRCQMVNGNDDRDI